MDVHTSRRAGLELKELVAAATDALAEILFNDSRLEKHGTYTWLGESTIEHRLRAARHILTDNLIKSGIQEPTEENHLDNAITRLLMVKAIELREKTKEIKE